MLIIDWLYKHAAQCSLHRNGEERVLPPAPSSVIRFGGKSRQSRQTFNLRYLRGRKRDNRPALLEDRSVVLLWQNRNPSGQENYENLRKISLQTVDCIIFAFSVRMQADLKLLKSYVIMLQSSSVKSGTTNKQKVSKYFYSPNNIPIPWNCRLHSMALV